MKIIKNICSMFLTVCLLLSLFSCLFLPVSAAGTTPDLVEIFEAGTWTCLKYTKGWSTISAGNYRFEMDCKIYSGTPVIQVGNDEIGTLISGVQTNYAATYDSTNFKYSITFTMTSNWGGNLGVLVGNYGESYNSTYSHFICANPALYKLDDSGQPIGSSLINTFASDYYSSSRTGNKWNKRNFESGKGTCTSPVPAGTFDPITDNEPGTPKMANVYYGFTYKPFIYNDSSLSLYAGETYVFSANVKVTSGTPTVHLYNAEGGLNSDLNTAAYTSAYTDVTSGNTRTVTFTMAKTIRALRIRIGNNSGNANVSASFANVRLVKLGTEDSLINDITSTSVVTSAAANRKWYIASQAGSGYSYTHDIQDIPEGYFEGTAQANMYYISGVTTAYSGLEKKTHLQANQTYILAFDWKAYSGAYPKVSLSYYDGSEWHDIAQTALPANQVDGSFVPITDNLLDTIGTNGHYAVSFTMPAETASGGVNNFNVRFGNYILNDDYFDYGRGATYFGNFVLCESGGTGNIILNGDLAIAKTGNITRADSGKFCGFEVTINKNNGSRDLYNELRILPQPENFFTANGASAAKVLKFNGGSWDYIDQNLLLKSNTAYRLTYKASYINGLGTHTIHQYLSSNTTESVTKISSSFDRTTSTVTYDFRTSADLRTVHQNAALRFVIPTNGSDIKFYIADVKLYEISGNAIIGSNLVNNGGFCFGDDAIFSNIASRKDANGWMPDLQFTGWYLSGSFEQNSSLDFAELTANSFPSVMTYPERMVQLTQVLLGKFAPTASNPYEDVNNDNTVNLLDLISTKKSAVEYTSDGNAYVDTKEQEFLATYVNGNNTTNLTALKNNRMLATDVTDDAVYYVSSSTGNDGNDGQSPATAWKTLAKANSVNTSGCAVLFKCGDTWRASTTENAALIAKSGVTYGSYGSGAKPQILGSIYNYANRTWVSDGTNIWKTSIKNRDNRVHSSDDVGLIVFDGEIGTMKTEKSALSQNGDYFNHRWQDSEGGDGYVYVYADENPASKWSDIEIGQKMPVVAIGGNNVTLNNLSVKYGGEHGISGGGLINIAVSNCEVNYIGGSFNSEVRFGNGIQFGQGGSNLRVKNCYVTNVFDSCITFQSWGDTVKNWSSINFSNNLMTDSFMGIEWFAQETSVIDNIYFTNNMMRNMGGWSYDERIGNPEKIGTWVCACLKVGQHAYHPNVSDFYIYDNIFDRSNGSLVFWWYNAHDVAEEDRVVQPGMHIYQNSFYQDNADGRDGRLITYNDEYPVYGASTGALRTAVSKFDPNPRTVRYILHDDRVIYQ